MITKWKSIIPFICFCIMLVIIQNQTLFGKPRESISMDGTWQFATDPDNVGETGKWFDKSSVLPTMPRPGYAPEANGTIKVPGIWDNQGYGTETDKVHHNFVGKGWYKKEVSIPASWKGESVWLTLEGISRYAKVWINGKSAGPEAIGCIGSHEYRIDSLVKPGEKADITICVDSKQRWEVDALFGASSLNDYMEIEWGGLWGHVTLECRPNLRLDAPYFRCNIEQALCIMETGLINETNNTSNLSLLLEVIDQAGKTVAQTQDKIDFSSDKNQYAITVKVPDLKLWTTDTPNLYTVRLFLLQGKDKLDQMTLRCGFREIKFVGNKILLNGKRIFLRGYGDDHIYPYDFSMPTNKEMLKNRMKIIKSFGFNHVRNHSAIHPHEYFEAMDELGILATGEFNIGYPHQLPGQGNLWKSKVPEGTDPEPGLETYRRCWAKVVREYRHHPSVFCWVGGNELDMLGWDQWVAMPLRYEMQKIAKQLDPDRYYVDTDGDWKNTMITKDRDTLAMLMILYDEWSSPIGNQSGKFPFIGFKKPVISHEAGNFLTFSRPDQIELFKCNYKPFWMTAGKEKLEKLGFMNEVEDWAKASEKLYLVHHKYNCEGMRLNSEISGYHWWLFQDYWTTSNGLVDLFFRPKSIKPEQVLPFNSAVVLVQKGLNRTCQSGEAIKVETFVSNFSENALSGTATIKLAVSGKDNVRTFTVKDCTAGELSELGEVDWQAPDVDSVQEAVLSVKLQTEKETWTNQWSIWIFPKKIVPKTGTVPVYVEQGLNVIPKEWKTSPIPSSGKLPAKAVYIVSWLEKDIITALEEGAGVILLDGSQISSAMQIKYQQTWWKAGDNSTSNHTGTFVYSDPITSALTKDNWCNLQWYELLQGAQKFDLEKFKIRPKVLIRALSSLVMVEDKAILYEVGVGKGTLFVNGLNLNGTINRPENKAIMAALINQAARFEQPVEKWLSSNLITPTVIPEGMILGYRKALNTDDQSWAVWKSYKEDMTRVLVCRQEENRSLTWETCPVSTDNQNKTVTFIFAGSMGFASMPQTKGFVLTINDKHSLCFDLVKDHKTTTWKSEDGLMSLKFDVLRHEPEDDFGIFYLTVPMDSVKKGTSQLIKVKSLGKGSRRWLNIQLYTDLSPKK